MKPWRWPGMWFKDEKFWRDVGSRTLAAVFAAGVIYVCALLGGYVQRPNTALALGFVVGNIVLLGLSILVGSKRSEPAPKHSRFWRRENRPRVKVALFISLGIYLVALVAAAVALALTYNF